MQAAFGLVGILVATLIVAWLWATYTAPVAKVAKPKSRSRAAKVTRLRLVWGVFNNSHQCVATDEYPKRGDAEAHAAKLTADKKNTHFVQPVKEPIEEKKEKA